MHFGAASACIPPCYVREAKTYVKGKLPICTVIGFPSGYSTSAAKIAEAEEAIIAGADEIDCVINVCHLKDKRYDDILYELRALKSVAQNKILKVIIETSLLTDEEKIKMCELVSESGADYIKTSTGFTDKGATFDDIALFAKHVSCGVKIKASGGIKTLEDAEKFIELGASRLGTSRIVKIIKNGKDSSGYKAV